jgi:acid phosphatase type 7
MMKNYQLFDRFLPKWRNVLVAASLSMAALLSFSEIAQAQIQFIYTSDAHYGITRTRFQKNPNVNATIVNGVMISKMNSISSLTLPADGGVNAGKKVNGIDYVMMTGDIANRQETPIQSATASWNQFVTDYINGLTLKNNASVKSKLCLLPGNHDVSNAVGYYKTMSPPTDSAAMVNIYNLMMGTRPSGNYNYANEKIHYSKNIGGVHFMFVCMWPDSAERVWMAADLATVNSTTPVFIFTHDQPAVESKHFTNPNGTHTINATNKFENLLLENFKDGTAITSPSTIEQRGFANFVKAHPNVVAYFHGNDNQNSYYIYNGPDNNIVLNVFQVDSPMKGNISATDETKLSFQLYSMDTIAKVMTVRECLWNSDTMNASAPIVFGASKTISYDLNNLASSKIQFIYTSDAHYGITRARFQKNPNVSGSVVNGAMISKMNTLSSLTLPKDGGINQGLTVGGIDYVIMTGDIANRQETPIQSATASWNQFATDYITNLTLKNNSNQKSKLYLLPGNHDVSNAIGYYKTMSPLKDSAAMVNIYSLMMGTRPSGNYNYANEKIHYSKNIGGVHFMFVCMWPDSAERVWMAADLATVSPTTPVFLFTHDQPSVESKHFTNPNGTHNINSTDKFENLLLEKFKDGTGVTSPSTVEQRGFANFVKAHPNVVAYFHGNDNQNSYYMYTGPDNNIILNVFQVDSPMKGNISATDETKLSFQLYSVDTLAKVLTVRECLWNSDTTNAAKQIVFGATRTILYAVDSIIKVANSLKETNYTVPSWTNFKRAYKTVMLNSTAANINKLGNSIQSLVSSVKPYNVNMTINGDPTSRMGFTWFTNPGITGDSVLIVEGNVDSTKFNNATKFASVTTNVTLNYNVTPNQLLSLAGISDYTVKSYVSHKAVATGLKPNTTYSYRVGKKGGYSVVGTFTTAKATKEPFTFMYFTDTQAQCDSMFDISQRTIHAAKSTIPTAKFALVSGDLIETSGQPNSEWEYEQWFETMQDVWNTTPLAPIEGNHDKSTYKNFSNHFNTLNPQFDKNMSTVPGSNYSFVYGNALFMALSYEDYSVAGYLDSVSTWMKAQVNANPNVRWRIAFFHKTMYTGSSSHQSDGDGKICRERMGPVFDSLKIDLALEGHDHVYEVIGPVNNKTRSLIPNRVTNQQNVIVDVEKNLTGKLGGNYDVYGGTLYFLNSSAGIKKYQPRTKAQMDAAEGAINMTNYWSLFTGRFGQTGPMLNGNDLNGGDPMFSSISVSTDSISITTYSVGKHSGVVTKYDAYRVVKITSNVYKMAQSLVDTNYTIPSWTNFKRVLATTPDDSVKLQAAINKLVNKNKPYNVNMTINGDPSSQMGFTWFTNTGITTGSVQLIEGVVDSNGFGSAKTISATTTAINNINYNVSSNLLSALAGIADNSKKSYVSHKTVATGLKPNTTYSYRVGIAGYYSEVGKFTSAKNTKEPFSFIYFTDPQANTDAMFDVSQKTTHAAVNLNPNANFMLTCGDLVETSGSNNSEWEYEQFFSTQQDIWYNKPFAPLMGNHDISTNKNFTNHFNTANPSFNKTMSTTPGSVYSFVYGDALFMALSYEDYSVTGYLDSLSNWMKQQVAANPNVKWRIAFFHKTMYTGSQSHQSDADGKIVRDKMGPLFDSLKIDLAMEGHDHVYEVMGPIKNKQLVNGAVSNQTSVARTVRDNLTGKSGGIFDVYNGTLYFLNNSAGKKKYEPRDSNAMKAAEATLGINNYFGMFTGRFGQTGEPTFSNISVTTDSIKISTYTVSDLGVATLFDSYKIVKVYTESVKLAPKSLNLVKDNNITITATVFPINSSNKKLIWSTTDATIADVVNGTITAKKVGTVSIIVSTVDGNKKDTCKVTVTPVAVTSVVIPDETKVMLKGTTFNTTAVVIPTNADNKSVTWYSTDPTIADVVNGTITVHKVGKVSIVVKTADGNKTDTCKVTVTPIVVTSVLISDKVKSMEKGTSFVLSAIVSPSNADNKNVTWSSTDATIADVINGTVTAKKVGIVSIIVKTVDGHLTDICKVTVTPANSINNNELQNSITIIPNPTQGFIRVKTSDDNRINYIEVKNNQGQSLIIKEANSNIADLDLSGYRTGNYLLIVHTKNGIVTKQIVRL